MALVDEKLRKKKIRRKHGGESSPHTGKDNNIYLSLVSQNKNQLNVEIVMDTDIDNFNEMKIIAKKKKN